MKWKWIISTLLVLGIAIIIWNPIKEKTVEAVELKQAGEDTAAEGTGEAEGSPLQMQKLVQNGGLTAAAENEHLILYFDNHSGGIAVQDKASGSMFYSNPLDALEDTKASDAMKQELMSQIKLVYNVKGKEGESEMNSYTQAMLLDQISWGKLEQGLRVEMVIGREEQRLLLPQQITKTSFEQSVLDLIDSAQEKKKILAYYILYTRDDLAGAKGQELLAKYPVLEDEDIYILKTSVTDRDKRVLEGYIKKTGYTYEKMEEDYERVGYKGDDASFPYFKLNMDYVLQDKGMSVTLDCSDISYNKDRFQIIKLSLLHYFGAGKTGEEGYIFLPDGSGTLIHFNNDASKNTLLTTGKVYGPDQALTQNARGSFKQEFRAPVFGVKKEGAALLSIIEEGEAAAEINGMLGDINHSWNTAYANFTIRNKDTFIEKGAFEQAPWIIYDKNEFNGKIKLRYYFLTGEDADYVGMASAYRQYLLDRGSLSKVTPSEDIPFYLDTMGSVEQMVRKLGIPVQSQVAVTSFQQAGMMLDGLSQSGINNIKLRYTGWYNGGYYHTAPGKLKVEKVLGGAKGLQKLADKAQSIGAQLFPDVDFVYVNTDEAFDGFKPHKDGIRSLFQKNSYKGYLDLPTLEFENNLWVIDPKKRIDYYNKFAKSYSSLGLNGLSLSTMGEGLHSNFKNHNQVNREQAKALAVDLLAQARTSYDDIISDNGNAYTYPYVDHLLNLPDVDSSFSIADQQVPFLQIALHGYIQYAGQALNLSNELRPAVLKALEYGSGVYFKLNYGESSMLKDASLFDEVHSLHYADWEEQAAQIYAEVNDALRDVQDQAIINHEQLEEQVYRTTYENGKSIIVNYSDQEIQVGGIVIGPVHFAVTKP